MPRVDTALVMVCNRRVNALWAHENRRATKQCSNMLIGTLAVDGWAVTFGNARWGLGPASPIIAVPNVTAHSPTANVPTL